MFKCELLKQKVNEVKEEKIELEANEREVDIKPELIEQEPAHDLKRKESEQTTEVKQEEVEDKPVVKPELCTCCEDSPECKSQLPDFVNDGLVCDICKKERVGQQTGNPNHVGVKSEQTDELNDGGSLADTARDAVSSNESEIPDSRLPQQVTKVLSDSPNFKNFVLLLEPYVAGVLSFENLVCTTFIDKGEITGCYPTGKRPNNRFVYELFKLKNNSKSPNNTNMYRNQRLNDASLHYGVNLPRFFGKRNKTSTFKPATELICAVFNYVFPNASSGLDWCGVGPFDRVKPGYGFSRRLQITLGNMTRTVKNKKINSEVYLNELFDPTDFFTLPESTPMTKRRKLSPDVNISEQENVDLASGRKSQRINEKELEKGFNKLLEIRLRRSGHNREKCQEIRKVLSSSRNI